jgi:hypothetical protein
MKREADDEEDDSWLDLMPDPEPIKLAQKPSFAFTVLSRVKGLLWHLTHLSSLIIFSLGKCGSMMMMGRVKDDVRFLICLGSLSAMESICRQKLFDHRGQITLLYSIPIFEGQGMGVLAILDGDVLSVFILDGLGATHSEMVWSRPSATSQLHAVQGG